MAKKFGYVIEDEPQFCVWDTREEAEAGRAEIQSSRTSDIIEFEEPTTPGEAYSLVDDVLREYASIGY